MKDAEWALRFISDAEILRVVHDVEIAKHEMKTDREFCEKLLAAVSQIRSVLIKVVD